MAPQVEGGEVVGKYKLEHKIGSGSFAVVFKARNLQETEDVTPVAVKVILTDKLSSKLRQSLESEVSILKRINHVNVVRLSEVIEAKNRLYLVMEYCGGGDLAGYIRRHKRVTEAVARTFLQQLGAGLQELWMHNFVHRDLKPQNLLLSDSSSSAVLKIADFGFARNLQPQGLADTLCGSPLYMAPEILQFHKYDAKADLWSVGIILYELVVGRPPFDGGNHVQLLRNIECSEARIPDQIGRQLSSACVRLIHMLLKRNPVERISFEEFFSHPFLAPGDLPPSPPSCSPEASMVYSPAQLPTIPSGRVLPTSSRASSGDEQLPFAMEARVEVQHPGRQIVGRAVEQAPLIRGMSEPPTPTARPPQPRQMPSFFTGLGAAVKAETAVGPTVTSNYGPLQPPFQGLGDSMEDEEDYVIIERTPSSSGSSGVRGGYSQSAPSGGFQRGPFLQVPAPPPPLTVPLLVVPPSPSAMPPLPPAKSDPLSRSVATLRFTAGLPRFESLKRVAFLLEDLAGAKQGQGACAESLALRLLSLQVLSSALDVAQQEGVKSIQDGSEDAILAISWGADIPHHLKTIADRADQVASIIQAEHAGQGLPDVWDLTYRSALALAKAAAVDELLAKYNASVSAYAKAGALFYFIFAEAVELPFQPPLHLAATDLRRLQRYTACVALRHQGCIALLAATSSSSKSLQEHVGVPRRSTSLEADSLGASLSAHPPLRAG